VCVSDPRVLVFVAPALDLEVGDIWQIEGTLGFEDVFSFLLQYATRLRRENSAGFTYAAFGAAILAAEPIATSSRRGADSHLREKESARMQRQSSARTITGP